jgi:hypothetical protein
MMAITYITKAEQDSDGCIVLRVIVGEYHTIRLSSNDTYDALNKQTLDDRKDAIARSVERGLRGVG